MATRVSGWGAVLGFTFLLATAPHIANAFSVEELTITQLHGALVRRQVTCEQVVLKYLDRIKRYNLDLHRGAPINAIVALNPESLEDARKLDQYYLKHKKLVGSLHCVPTLLKDNIDSIDTPSTSGTLALLGSQPIRDAFLVKQLRKEGAVILGKTTMDELAAGAAGMSSRSGKTGNAYDPNRTSGGSSAGSAAAVSANFAMIAIGSDNSGSLRIPASYNGLYTLRSTTGLISQEGVFPRGSLDGVAGPMTRTVKDLAIVMDALATKRPKSYREFLHSKGLKGKRIGILRQVGKVDQFRTANVRASAHFEKIFSRFEKLGAVLVREVQLPEFNSDRSNNMAGEVEEIDRYLASFPSSRSSYADLCASGRAEAAFGEGGCLQHIKETPKKDSSEYRSVLKTFEKNRSYVEGVLNQLNLDALLVPIDSYGVAGRDYRTDGLNGLVATNAGLPGMAIIGDYFLDPQAMPFGIELVGRQYSEGTLIEMAYAYEQHGVARVAPSGFGPGTEEFKNDSLADLNRLFTVIGWRTYEKLLKTEQAHQLTAPVFRSIVQEVLEDRLHDKRSSF